MTFIMNCMTFTKVNTTTKIDRLSVKNQKKLDYKQLRLSDNYLYSSEEEQEISRLPIALAQLEAGTNSEKLKNEIRQLLYSLYCSKNMTKQVYNNLINYT